MKTPISSRSIRQHFTYSWWKYLLLAALCIFLVSILFDVTEYRPPAEKTVEFYVYGMMNEEELNAYMEQVRQQEMSDMELMSAVLMSPDETYGPMQLMTYLAAGEGDLFLLPRDQFVSYASSGTMVTLETDDDLMALLSDAGISVQTGWRRNTETGETHLCGIPLDKLPGLYQYLYAKDGYLCVPVSSKNIENALAFLRILCRDNVTAPAESDSGQPSETVSP